jgi:hypothetical protein
VFGKAVAAPHILRSKESNHDDKNPGHLGTGQSGKSGPTGRDPWPRVFKLDELRRRPAQIQVGADQAPLARDQESSGGRPQTPADLGAPRRRRSPVVLFEVSFLHRRLKRVGGSGHGAQLRDINESSRKAAPESPEYDPARNLRERLNKPPGFQFDERPPHFEKAGLKAKRDEKCQGKTRHQQRAAPI